MSKKKEEPFNNPFGKVKLAQKAEAPKAAPPPAPTKAKEKPKSLDAESALFLESVGAVEPVRAVKSRVGPKAPPTAAEVRLPNEEAESLARLAELVSAGAEFDVEVTGESLEGAVRGFDERVLKRLKAGEFPPQAELDLHGQHRDDARRALEAFIERARIAGHRCVRVVTGRGLNSEGQVPVLKQGVPEWLTRGRTGRQVLAFCTARPKDGGPGAIVVLLRR